MQILISLAAQQKGFFISLGCKLAGLGHDVTFAARDPDVEALILRLAPEFSSADILRVEHLAGADPINDVIHHALEVEEKYGVRLSMLLSYDRALGRGYIFNADRYPPIGRAKWGHERKLAYILKQFSNAEALVDRCSPDLIIGHQKDIVLYTVANYRGTPYLTPASVKLGHRFIWSDDPYITSTDFIQAIHQNVGRSLNELPPAENYVQESGSKFRHAQLSFTWRRSVLDAYRIGVQDLKKVIRHTRKKESYPLFGWLPSVFRRTHNYRFFLREGVRPSDLAERRAVYVPLHLEPEIALLALSPEFSNSMEMIAWISKSLPADTIVVVKEQPFSFGVRSKRYYEQLIQIGNVLLAHPETTSHEWIQATNVTATITGTAAIEAVAFGRPVLSFGRHQAVNLLPTVRLAENYESAKCGLDDLLKLDPADTVFELSRRALNAAQISCSFEMPEFAKAYSSAKLESGLAEKAFVDLLRLCPSLAVSEKSLGISSHS